MATYYIKPLSPYSVNGNEFFDSNIKKIKFKEENNNLWVNGELEIHNHANLPNFSYFLRVNSTLANLDNINLSFCNRFEKERNKYFIDTYQFSFMINLNSWSQFNNYLNNENFAFELIPIFNQNVIKDFHIDVSTEDLQSFIYEMNHSIHKININYSNCYRLTNSNRVISFDNFDDNNKIWILNNKIEDNVLKHALIFDEGKQHIKIKNIKANIIYTNSESKTNSHAIDLNINRSKTLVYLDFDSKYVYNQTNNTFDKKIADDFGLFCNEKLALKLNIELDLEISSLSRKIIYEHDFNFCSDNTETSIKKIDINYFDTCFDYDKELKNYV